MNKYLILIPEEKRPKAVEPTRNESFIRSLQNYLLLNYFTFFFPNYSKLQHLTGDFQQVKEVYSPICFALSFFHLLFSIIPRYYYFTYLLIIIIFIFVVLSFWCMLPRCLAQGCKRGVPLSAF